MNTHELLMSHDLAVLGARKLDYKTSIIEHLKVHDAIDRAFKSYDNEAGR